jgi:polysaccharide transporter, PST family
VTRKRELGEAFSARVIKGAVWLFTSFALSRIGRLAMMLIVAAVLSPRAFGIVTLSTIFLVVGVIIAEFGIWQAVVQRPDPDEHYLNTAFTVNIPIAFAAAAGLFLTAPWIADVLAEPKLSLMLRVMGPVLLLEGITYVPDGLLRKELRFKERVLPEISGIFAFATVTIALLLIGVGVVSYAVGFVAESAVRCSLTIWTAVKKIRWRPKLQVYRAHLRDLFSYGKHVLGFELVKYASSNVDFVIVGRVLGAGSLGFYALAFNLANYPVTNLALILSKVAFPTFATLQEDIDYARRVYLKMLRLLAAVTVPVLTLAALLATPLITELLGEKWQPAVFPLQAMVLAGISRTVSIPSIDMLRAVGRANVSFKISVIEGCALVPALLLIVQQGVNAVALTVTAILSLTSWATMGAACRVLGVGIRELILSLMPSVLLAASGAGAVFSLRLLDLSFLPGIADLVLLLTAAGGAMVICLATLCRSLFWEIVGLAGLARPR